MAIPTMRRVTLALAVFFVTATVTVIYFDDVWYQHPTAVPEKGTSSSCTKETKVVAFWDASSAKPDPLFGMEKDPFSECSHSRCVPLSLDGTLEDADAVIFNTRNMDLLWRPKTFPKRTSPCQIFVFFNMESPLRTKGLLDHPAFNDAFNLTMTYRRDSDIPTKLIDVVPIETEVPERGEDYYKSKSKMAVWFISSCSKSGSPRIQYAKELAKYIGVDIYGACGNLSCPKEEQVACMRMASETYKFYLSFENSACTDYVTEKLKKPLSDHMVPVVMGGVDYNVVAPPHSVIDVRDYRSPKELAEYLKLLNSNDTLYQEYFRWKKTYQVIGAFEMGHGYCELCDILHNSTYPYKSGFNAHDWWYRDTCVPEENFTRNLGL